MKGAELRHESRLQLLQLVGVPLDHDLRRRVSFDYDRPRPPEQVARDEAAIAALEAEHSGKFAELERRERRDRLAHYDLPITEADASLIARDALEATRVLRATRAWLDGEVPLLVLSGPPGRGKTCAAANALVSLQKGGGAYVRAIDIARLFLASFGPEVERREQLVRTPRLLVVDDIGTERQGDAMCTALVEVLDARRRAGKRNLWCTNLSRQDFAQRYADVRLHSRMVQSAQWCVDAGVDLRRPE